ncbi:MAG: 1-deoxy-D-xylulose-5-phosphate synthase [Candidatus Liptonbacteria bacterium]|nr:1-deoxy-D-xylulose-5-phosphate synthase [Candidatus Liptonbacteria bacterium]
MKGLVQRDAFFDALYKVFLKDKKTMLISADNGAKSMDQISELPGQFRNVGIAEEQAVGMACGHALEGRRVWIYAIDPFITLRCLEFVKLDMCAMNLPITALGVGAGYAYDIMGPTHHAVGVIAAMRVWPNLTIWSPADNMTAEALAEISYNHNGPQYIRFDRGYLPNLYENNKIDFCSGVGLACKGKDVAIISTGVMVHQACRVADQLEEKGVSARVIDLFRLKPINQNFLFQYLEGVDKVVTLEEDFLAGGMGSAIAEVFVDNDYRKPLLRIGQRDTFVFDLGGREVIWKKYGLDVESVTQKILNWT